MIIMLYTEHHSKTEILFLAVHQMKSTIYFEYCQFWGWKGWGKEHVKNISITFYLTAA